ncbi:MAG: hypothetical protein QNJ91_05830 [Gammaproteobacteria bacterium]|nr:hypothetical protein [Gammaproteobacteria bacterium]
MISGRQALGSIDQSLNAARAEIAAVQQQVTEASERVLALQQAQADDYRALARIRVDELRERDVIEHLDAAERQVIALLEKRTEAFDELKRSADENQALRDTHEARRREQAARLDAAVAAVDEAEQVTQRALEADPQYQAQRTRAEDAERKARHAADKAARSAEEREQKGRAYQNDPLFTYLWERSYGLPAYAASGLVRWLDGKVARLIGYADARANYARLNEIPARLDEHAANLRTVADGEFATLRERDDAARAADGIPALDARVAAEQRALDDIDNMIEERERRHAMLLEQIAAYAAGEDEQMRQAVEFLAREFRRDGLVELREAALRTPYPDDDLVVGRMLDRDDERLQTEARIDGLRSALKQHRDRVIELEQIRVDFKRNRYDRAGSVFTNDAIVPMLLKEFLAGILDRGTLWKVLREHQRYRARRSDPGFGSGGFGRGTVWKGGLGDLGDIIGGIGRGGFGGRGGGGGFRTGGGF